MTVYDPEVPAAMSRHDLVAVGAGVLVFIASFLPWYGVTFHGGLAEAGVNGSVDAWHGLAGVGVILLLFSAVATAAEPLLGEDRPTWLGPIVAALLACLGAAFVLVKSFSLPAPLVPGATTHLEWGGWILIVLVVVEALVSVLRVVHAGDAKRDYQVQ
ncbi:MAG TPA: DUF5336 domain-containing protein [Mycobacteriales bacterium]|nr:DUF5336 domain-containing protein [Mycobacteriales bacterium]